MISHPLQSNEWASFREKSGIKVITEKDFVMTLHKVPKLNYYIGYVPRGTFPDKKIVNKFKEIGKREKCVFIQIEPNIEFVIRQKKRLEKLGFIEAAHPLFTRYSFVLDLNKTEEEILKNMHSKTRYNIRVAEKHGVKVHEDNSNEAFEKYLELLNETTKRQNFYAHTEKYHRQMWETLKTNNKVNKDKLSAHLFLAKFNNQILAAWILFVYKDSLYYPYGASSSKNREVMASNLMMWEAIKFGKKLGLKKFDMWGALSEDPDTNDSWYGFHKFKQGYGPRLVKFIGSYDLVIRPSIYFLYKALDKPRWLFLKIKARTR